jgi:hypothetical protein
MSNLRVMVDSLMDNTLFPPVLGTRHDKFHTSCKKRECC